MPHSNKHPLGIPQIRCYDILHQQFRDAFLELQLPLFPIVVSWTELMAYPALEAAFHPHFGPPYPTWMGTPFTVDLDC